MDYLKQRPSHSFLWMSFKSRTAYMEQFEAAFSRAKVVGKLMGIPLKRWRGQMKMPPQAKLNMASLLLF